MVMDITEFPPAHVYQCSSRLCLLSRPARLLQSRGRCLLVSSVAPQHSTQQLLPLLLTTIRIISDFS